jgi:dolichol-phosphate mannosyltransferase
MTFLHARALSNHRLISVVLGTYNERENLPKVIDAIEAVFENNKLRGEIVVVDDSSPDGTSDLVKELAAQRGNIRLMVRPSKMGPGSAHADGYRMAEGDVIIGMDTDFSHDPYDIPRFLGKLDEGYDVVQASRYIAGGSYEVNSSQTRNKKIASKYGNILISFVTRCPVHDFTTSFRAIRSAVVKNVRTASTGNAFFMEFLVRAHRKGYKIVELPILFRDRAAGKSKLKLGPQSVKMLWELGKLWVGL